jgi:protein SCO1/2
MRWKLLLSVLLAFAFGGALAYVLRPVQAPVEQGEALIGGPFALVDQTGKPVTGADYAGKHLLVMFGFTHCPDICPTALQVMAGTIDALGPKADKLVPIFITVDPSRDTAEVMQSYVTAFHPKIQGLTGTEAQIAAVTKAYRVFARRVEDAGSPDGYTMDHSALIYFMDPAGRYVMHFRHNTSPDQIVARIAPLL